MVIGVGRPSVELCGREVGVGVLFESGVLEGLDVLVLADHDVAEVQLRIQLVEKAVVGDDEALRKSRVPTWSSAIPSVLVSRF